MTTPLVPVKYCVQSVGALARLKHSRNVTLIFHSRSKVSVPVPNEMVATVPRVLAASTYTENNNVARQAKKSDLNTSDRLTVHAISISTNCRGVFPTRAYDFECIGANSGRRNRLR